MDMDLDLGHVFGSLSDAQCELIKVERKWLSRAVAVRDEIHGLKGALADETKRLTDTQLALQERETKIAALEGERDAALAAPKESRKKEKANRKAASMFKRARRNTKHTVQAFDAIVIALQVQQRKVEAESAEFKREANAQLTSKEMEKSKVLKELDEARTSLEHEKNFFTFELGDTKAQRDVFKLERDEQKAKVAEERDVNLKLKTSLEAAESEMRCLMVAMQEEKLELEDKKAKMERCLKRDLEAARSQTRTIHGMLAEANGQKMKLQADLRSLNVKCNELETSRRIIQKLFEEERGKRVELETSQRLVQKNLDEESEKSLCQICFEAPKDSIAFPCLHLSFCNACLESHRAQNRTCPMCRTNISGVLKCVISI
ncbi:unnamed protein product [Calypogeia fissa]